MFAGAAVLQTQISVVHRPRRSCLVAYAEQISQSEVVSSHTPLIVEARFVSRYDAAAPGDILAELIALRPRHACNIREDQGLELPDLGALQHPVVHHLKGNTRLDQRLIPSERVILDPGGGAFAPIEPGGLL